MLKRLAILAIAAFTVISVPGQPNKAANTNLHPTNRENAAGVEPASEQQNEAAAYKGKSGSNTPGWYKALETPDWWLVILGFGTLVVVGCQTRILASSVKAAQTAADAAKESALAAMGISVPWLGLCEFSFVVDKGRENPILFYGYPFPTLVLKNFGQSPALLKQYGAYLRWDHDPEIPEARTFDEGTIIEPGGALRMEQYQLSIGLLPDERIVSDLITGKRILGFSFWVTYGDVFGSPIKRFEFERYLIEYDPDPSKMAVADRENARDFIEESKEGEGE